MSVEETAVFWDLHSTSIQGRLSRVRMAHEAAAAIRIDTTLEALRQGLQTLFGMADEQRQQMGRNGICLVREKFHWPTIACRMRAVYDWVVGGGQPPPTVRLD